jgi:hypothetical protein
VSDLKQETVESKVDGDHDLFAHYVDKNEATKAMIFGTPVIALCGKVWVPSRDPEKFPVCPECKRIYELFIVKESN